MSDKKPSAFDVAAGLHSTRGEREEVHDKTWKDTTISVDGYRFVRCRFDNCTFVYSIADFEFVECVVIGAFNFLSQCPDGE